MNKKIIFSYLFFFPICCFSSQILTSNWEGEGRSKNTSLLHDSCSGGRLDLVKLFFGKGANPNEKTKYGGNLDCINIFLEKGVNVDSKDNKGIIPRHFACWENKSKRVTVLLGKGVNPNDQNKDRPTPFHKVCKVDYLDVDHYLVARGRSLNAGKTSLQ